MNILVVGAGAREHALCWKLAQESGISVLCAPGNPGIGTVARLAAVAVDDIEGLLDLAQREHIALTVVGPEIPLALGLTNRFSAAGQVVLGPSRTAALLESSKAFAKEFMTRHGVPTASFRVCDTPQEARRAVDEFGVPVVLKADGLAAGKGVVVADDLTTAWAAIDAAMVAHEFGAAGARIVVEEFLRGEEASFFALCDGTRGIPIGTAQDHKRAFDHDRGPNTGGMGAFAPAVVIDSEAREQIERSILEPVLAGMAAEGAPFRGFLYVGLMMTAIGPRVIEFNVRFGDPEAQVVVPSIAEPLAPWLAHAAEGKLWDRSILQTDESLVGVVIAAGGYPGSFERGKPIAGIASAAAMPGVLVFQAGTAFREGQLVTNGGRVLTIVGRGSSYDTAVSRAYEAVERIDFEGIQFRRDIGRKALGRSPRHT